MHAGAIFWISRKHNTYFWNVPDFAFVCILHITCILLGQIHTYCKYSRWLEQSHRLCSDNINILSRIGNNADMKWNFNLLQMNCYRKSIIAPHWQNVIITQLLHFHCILTQWRNMYITKSDWTLYIPDTFYNIVQLQNAAGRTIEIFSLQWYIFHLT